MEGYSVETPWRIINSYFEGDCLNRLVRHQHESYNMFINTQISKTIEMFNPVRIKSEQDKDQKSGEYRLEIILTFENFRTYRPQIHENNGAIKIMFPQEARLRNFTYATTSTVDINIHYIVRSGPMLENKQNFYKTIPNVHLGKIPIMVKSDNCVLSQHKHLDSKHTGECKYDAGGYLIISGSEKTVLCQERAAENRVYCFNVSKTMPKYSWSAEIKSIPSNKCISPKQISVLISSKTNGFGYPIYVSFPRMKQPVPLFTLFRALGVISDKNICQYIFLDIKSDNNLKQMYASIYDANTTLTQESSIRQIMSYVMFTPIGVDKETGIKKKWDFTIEVLTNDLFPHCLNIEQKKYFLGYMVRRLLNASNNSLVTDRDSYSNKRIDAIGPLLNNLYRNYFNRVVKDAETQILHEINNGSWRSSEDYLNIITHSNIYKIIKSNTIENGLKRALSTGDFAVKHSNSSKVGVAQVLNRLTYAATISHLRRISTPIDKSGKHILPRKLYGTSWGYVCPFETPEGASIGIVRNMSYMTHITVSSNILPLYDYILPHINKIEDVDSFEYLHDSVKVFINGAWVGVIDDAINLYNNLKSMKYKGIINIYTSIIFDISNKEIRICNDAGRLTRPLLRVRNNRLLFNKKIEDCLLNKSATWNDLLTDIKFEESVIEYIDSEEQQYILIATNPSELSNMSKKYTHCEIHPSTILGVIASCIPFSNHNQSPRNTYQSAMGKQSIGISSTNDDKRMDKTALSLTYPARPLVDTRIMGIMKLNRTPAGRNIVVAIMTYTGYNQEDSLLVNEGSIKRGLFTACVYHTEKDEDKQKINGSEEIRCKPIKSKTRGMKLANYDKVNNKGLIPEETLVENRDIIISVVVPIKENRNDHMQVIKYEDQSKLYRTTEESYIDKNYINKNGEGYNVAKVKIRTTRIPVVGDKFSSRHGQKGTVGHIISEEDMPFMDNGIRPDVIINPHAIPSRMTIGQLKETLLGKVIVELGLFGDGTCFESLSVDDISKKLLNCGHSAHGNEIMYNPLTGEQLESSIFIGPTFYQRLKHMVNDKQHSRSTGPTVNLTHQPAEGKSRDGGLRFGEMERDCMISHGASRFTQGRMMDASDKYKVHVCNQCGMIASFNEKVHIHFCRMCENRTDFSLVKIPYSCKLLFQELQAMNVSPRIITDSIINDK